MSDENVTSPVQTPVVTPAVCCQPPNNGKKSKQYFRPSVGIIYLLGTFAIFCFVLSGKVDPASREMASMIVGALITKSGTIIDWAFGSSQGSDKKTDMMADK